ncbi:MAG: YwiC-like family protein, partial [Anaerolineales bacterium]
MKKFLLRYIAIPQDHGSWVFLLSPLLIGLFAGGNWSSASAFLIIAALAGFLIRQPTTIVVKTYTGRRSRRDLPAAFFWISIYSIIGMLALGGLILLGYQYILLLGLPGILVFAWYLYLVSQRSERHKIGVGIVASGVLALNAPAAYWVGVNWSDPRGWWLFILIWLQSAASIVYAYLRLNQRNLPETTSLSTRISLGRRALLYTTFNLLFVLVLSISGVLPILLPLPYALQWVETLWGTVRPAIGVKPTAVGFRQLFISTIFTILFILTW